MRRSLIAAVVILGLGFSTQARAETKVSVLDLDAGKGAGSVATRITAQLKRLVGNTSSLSIVAGKSLAEIKLIFGCTERPRRAYHRCLAKAGKSMNTDRIIVGKVRKKGSRFKVMLTLVDVHRPLRPQTVSERIPRSDTSAAKLAGHVRTWFDRLFGRDREGYLSVTCNASGVSITVAGRNVGECGTRATRLTLKPGTHKLSFAKAGFFATERIVSVTAGGTSQLSIELKKKAPRDVGRIPPDRRQPGVTPPKGTKKDSRMGWKVAFYTTLSAGAAMVIASIFTGMQVKALEGDKEDRIRYLHDHGIYPGTDNACRDNASDAELVDICNKGTTMATVTNALVGIGAALIAGSGVFLYYAYFKSDSKESATQPGTTSRAFRKPSERRLMVTPSVWVNGGGISATLRF